MSDIYLQKPQANQVVVVAPQANDRLVFEFQPSDALLERDGDNLVLSFEDGSSIELADFYVAYTSENMPEFVIEGAIVPGEAFFAALSEDLMPAAGNESGNSDGSGNSVDTVGADLLSGLGRTGGLNANNGPENQDGDAPNTQNNVPPTDGGTDGGAGAGGEGGDGGNSAPVDNGVVLEHNYESVTAIPVETTYFTGNLDFSTADVIESGLGREYNNALDDSSFNGDVTIRGGKILYKDADGNDIASSDKDMPYELIVDQNVSDGGTHALDVHQREWNKGEGIGVAGGHSSWSELGYENQSYKNLLDADGNKVLNANGAAVLTADTDNKSEYSEAMIFDLPEGETAYGANIELDNLYPAGKQDSFAEKARVDFYLDGKLVKTVEIEGTRDDGYALVQNSDVPFDRIVLSAQDIGDRLAADKYNGHTYKNNSDFMVKNVTFLAPAHVAEAAGNVDAIAADGFDQFYFDGLTIDGVKVGIDAEGNIDTSETLSLGGKELTLTLDPATNTLVGSTEGNDQFSITLNQETGEWKMIQNESFTEDLTLSVGGKDVDGSSATIDIDITPSGSDNTISGTDSVDNIDGGVADDVLMGLAGDDTLNGESGDDLLYGGSGDDSLFGGVGDDALFGGSGADSLYGGEGSDVIEFDISDVLVDGSADADGGDLDILLGGAEDKQNVINKMNDGDITNMEMIVLGDVEGKTSDDVLAELGLSKNADDEVVVPSDEWTQQGDKQTIGGREFMEFTNDTDNTTILVEATKLESGNI